MLEVWQFPLEPVHTKPVLPNEPGLLAYRAAIRAAGRVERHPALHVPAGLDEAQATVWRDEGLNNDVAYAGEAGSIDDISCLDALLFAEQNARIPQLERPTEFLSSVLRKVTAQGEEVVVVFGAGSDVFPPRPAYGGELMASYLAQGWQLWYSLHNHPLQANGALGVPVPSTNDVQLARNLARGQGLERVRVTNGFYTFDAAVEELSRFRAR